MKTRTENQRHEMLDTVERLFIQHGIHLLDHTHKNLYREERNNLLDESATLLVDNELSRLDEHYGKKSGRKKCTRYSQNGITLVALVVTVVILLILAGVSIGTLFGDHGIIKKAQEAVDKTQEEVEKEQKGFENLLQQLNSLGNETGGNTEGGGDIPEVPAGWDTEQITPVESADNKMVPVPKGFTASEVKKDANNEAEDTVVGGFVIYKNLPGTNDGDEANKVTNANVGEAKTSRSQFVWVPYSEFKSETTSMFTVDTEGKPAGQLYDFGTSSSPKNPAEKIPYPTTKNSGYIEPDVVTEASSGQDSTSGSNYDAKTDYLGIVGLTGANATAINFKEQLQEEFNKMKESVEKYGGFYIGRYETGGLNEDKAKVIKGQGDGQINNQNWYTQYQKSKKIAEGTSATSSMIWGCQWDATMNWFLNQEGDNATYVTNATVNGVAKGNYRDQNGNEVIATGSNEDYKVNNIYDMTGNVCDWTLEADDNVFRVLRGR